MTWYKKLNKWQRLGIILSILWAVFGGLHQHNADVEQANNSAKFTYDVCVYGQQVAHRTDLKNCELKREETYGIFVKGDEGNLLIVALAPLPFAWLAAFVLSYVLKAQLIGFRAVIPWKALNAYKKCFVVFCGAISTACILFYVMGILNLETDSKVPVALSSLKDVIKTGDNYVLAEGTWVRTDLTNDSIMNPLQTSKISCVKDEGRCYQSTASASGNVLMTDFDEYQIDNWTDNSIIFHDEELCATTVYTIDLNTKTVSGAGHAINKNTPVCAGPLLSPNSHDEWGLLLSNGFNVYWDMHQKARPYLLKIIQSWFGN